MSVQHLLKYSVKFLFYWNLSCCTLKNKVYSFCGCHNAVYPPICQPCCQKLFFLYRCLFLPFSIFFPFFHGTSDQKGAAVCLGMPKTENSLKYFCTTLQLDKILIGIAWFVCLNCFKLNSIIENTYTVFIKHRLSQKQSLHIAYPYLVKVKFTIVMATNRLNWQHCCIAKKIKHSYLEQETFAHKLLLVLSVKQCLCLLIGIIHEKQAYMVRGDKKCLTLLSEPACCIEWLALWWPRSSAL